MSTRATLHDLQRYRCSFCDAAPDEPCIGPSGGKLKVDGLRAVHGARLAMRG
jgi:hypothetical protein